MMALLRRSLIAGLVIAAACSDDPGGGGNGSANGGNGSANGGNGSANGGNGSANGGNGDPACKTAFCLENDQRLTTDPVKLVYTDLPVGESATLELKVRNTGKKGRLVVSDAVFEVPQGGLTPPEALKDFHVVDWKPFELDPQGAVTLKVQYTPTFQAGKGLRLVLANNSTDKAQQKHAVEVVVQGGGVALLVNPQKVLFGNVAGGKHQDEPAAIVNAGTAPVELASIVIGQSGSQDFTVAEQPDLSKPLAAGASVKVLLRYKPTNGDKDEGTLVVQAKSGHMAVAGLEGNEIAPNIAVTPPKLNFGAIAKGQPGSRPLKVSNIGLSKLDVSKIEFVAAKDLDAKVAPALPGAFTVKPQTAFSLEPDGALVLTVDLKMPEGIPNKGAPIADMVLHSNDPGDPQLHVPVFAATDSPKLKVIPDDAVEFSVAAKGIAVKRKVSLFNEGTAPVQVSAVTLDDDSGGEFKFVAGFGPAQKNPSSLTLEGGKNAEFELEFVPKTATGMAKGKLTIASDDPTKPVWPLNLFGERAESATCKVMLVPGTLNFGVLPFGTVKTLPIGFKNVGTGYCVFDKVHVLDCSPAAAFPLPGVPPSPSECKQVPSLPFKSFAPSTKLFNLGPGETGQLGIEFTAKEDTNIFAQADKKQLADRTALLVAQFKDAASGLVSPYPPVDVGQPAAVKAAKPNLLAKVGEGAVQVVPNDVDFGTVTVGCKSKVHKVLVYNSGATEVNVTKLEFIGCGPEVEGKGWPAIPKDGYPVKQSGPASFGVQYAPQNVGKDQCSLMIYTGLNGTCIDKNGTQTGKGCEASAACNTGAGEWCMGQSFAVPLQGVGTLDDEFTDEFVQGEGKKVDVLFVIDNSGSMSEEQKNLADNFKNFIQVADIWKNDYHLGVVTTDMDGTSPFGGGAVQDSMGRLRETSGVRIVTPKTPNPTATFQKLANAGDQGSGNEQGLAAAKAALTAPLATDLQKACAKDGDCGGGALCVTGADDGQKGCGGFNRTFLRKNTGLEVVILSDEEDGSMSDPSFFINFFYGIKGLANKNLFHLHAIVGDKGSGCKGAGGSADAGNKYIEVAQKTGGKVASICSANFAQALKDIGTVAFGLQAQFFLTRTPDESTIDVKVNGAPCPKAKDSWAYDEPSNSVTFVEGGKCMPQKGQKVSIHYKMLCFP
jgi:hypothetical protein